MRKLILVLGTMVAVFAFAVCGVAADKKVKKVKKAPAVSVLAGTERPAVGNGFWTPTSPGVTGFGAYYGDTMSPGAL